TSTVMDLLEKQLDDCAVFIAYIDDESKLLRILDFRGDEAFSVVSGQTMELPAGQVAEASTLDPARALLSQPAFKAAKSYVGIPLERKDGSNAGTLCAIAQRTERFQHNELELLRVMARVLANELERERTEKSLLRQQEDLKRSNRRLRLDANTDALTGIANRRTFDAALAREWKLAQRGTINGFLMLVDLDDFKAVNDRYGHATGDQVLIACGRALSESARETDIVSRIGGDEFAVILVGCNSAEEVAMFRDRARSRFAELLASGPVQTSFASGHQALAEAPSPLRAIELADQAMYWQKRRRDGQGHPISAARTHNGTQAAKQTLATDPPL
ncbi:MAG: sensor domain-containing diguanylate cyclase, partial [Thermoleophilaceae bacterium]|nr:sensor domain-containing diguanylate cyclase [Thermoleophilaceae bacterium]